MGSAEGSKVVFFYGYEFIICPSCLSFLTAVTYFLPKVEKLICLKHNKLSFFLWADPLQQIRVINKLYMSVFVGLKLKWQKWGLEVSIMF